MLFCPIQLTNSDFNISRGQGTKNLTNTDSKSWRGQPIELTKIQMFDQMVLRKFCDSLKKFAKT